jgi:putative transposase
MARIARVALVGVPYHVTQRGNARQQVFFSDADCQLYLDLVRAQAGRQRLQIWAYCLMPNHVHFVVVPERTGSMARAFGRAHADYARHFNLQRRSCGHVWQARYYSCPLDRVQLWLAMAYVERNPVRAALVPDASDYPWSSAAAHTGQAAADWLRLEDWQREYSPERWGEVLRTSVFEEALAERIRSATLRGRPLGEPGFIDQLEHATGRRLRPRPVGRPKKPEAQPKAALALRMGNGI